MTDADKKIENLENQITGLKIKIARLEDFARSFPDPAEYFRKENDLDEDDPLLEEAKKIIIEYKKASASLIQRRMSIGYARSARMIDQMEAKGWISKATGSNPREVLVKD